MMVGTKSVLFGAHCFFIHPWFVAAAWWKLYGFPWDPRLWVAFFVHDLGYWGKPNMDGPEGERHPEWGARVMRVLFDGPFLRLRAGFAWLWRIGVIDRATAFRWEVALFVADLPWHDLVLYHSRFLAKRDGARPSRLCIADKLAICLTPAWLYLPIARATGEIREYRALGKDDGAAHKYTSMNVWSAEEKQWYLNVQAYLRKWVEEHRDGRADGWTPDAREARDDSGVWS